MQSLIKNALRVSSPALAASLRRVLDGIHSQRLTPGTDAMMLRLYHPLLFRDLAVANAGVRNNAMHLLVDVFPLQDSSAPPEVGDLLSSTAICLCSASSSLLAAAVDGHATTIDTNARSTNSVLNYLLVNVFPV